MLLRLGPIFCPHGVIFCSAPDSCAYVIYLFRKGS